MTLLSPVPLQRLLVKPSFQIRAWMLCKSVGFILAAVLEDVDTTEDVAMGFRSHQSTVRVGLLSGLTGQALYQEPLDQMPLPRALLTDVPKQSVNDCRKLLRGCVSEPLFSQQEQTHMRRRSTAWRPLQRIEHLVESSNGFLPGLWHEALRAQSMSIWQAKRQLLGLGRALGPSGGVVRCC